MVWGKHIGWAIFGSFLLAATTHAETPNDCPNPEGFRPSEEQLQAVLEAHEEWVAKRGWEDPTVPGKAILCNADLIRANLRRVHLRLADLSEANLSGAELTEADLTEADLSGAKLIGANLSGAYLSGARMFEANPRLADLTLADLADRRGANLSGAYLIGANLTKADLSEANLSGADLWRADLSGADLRGANLSWARLTEADIDGAKFTRLNLTNATYAPISAPAKEYLAGIVGLATVSLPEGQQGGLVQLRALLMETGLRDLEREATYAIEHWNTQYAPPVERALKLVFLEWTTGYGLHYDRPLAILLALLGLLAFVYMVPILTTPDPCRNTAGIYRIWPRERLEVSNKDIEVAENAKAERLCASFPAALGYSLYFSALSAFHIGWRDLNVGSWIMRIQSREWMLRGRGWVRVVTGLQSLISVYLLAMWALTYFGRPFE